MFNRQTWKRKRPVQGAPASSLLRRQDLAEWVTETGTTLTFSRQRPVLDFDPGYESQTASEPSSLDCALGKRPAKKSRLIRKKLGVTRLAKLSSSISADHDRYGAGVDDSHRVDTRASGQSLGLRELHQQDTHEEMASLSELASCKPQVHVSPKADLFQAPLLPTPQGTPRLRPVNSPSEAPPTILFIPEPGNSKTGRPFLPLSAGHPMLMQWKKTFPLIRTATLAILGRGNKGSIEFCSVNGQPSLCITCRRPSKIDTNLLHFKLAEWGFPAVVCQGSLKRSCDDNDPRTSWSIPAVNGRYSRRVFCGASLGTAAGKFSDHKVTLGGYIKVKHQGDNYWTLYAETVHHALEPEEDEMDNELGSSDGENSDLSDSEDNTPGVREGALESYGREIKFCSPAKPDFSRSRTRAEKHLQLCRLFPRLGQLYDHPTGPEPRPVTEEDTAFGKAIWSSGLCKDRGAQVRF